MPLGMVHVPSLPQPLSRQPPLRGGGLFIGAAMSNAVKTRQRETKATHPAQFPAAQPTQTRTGGQSRRSSTRQDKRTNARLRPRTQPNPKRRSQPKRAPAAKPPQQHQAGQARQREISAQHPPNSKLHSQPKRAPAAKPPQQRTAGYTHPRKTKGPGVRVRKDNPTQRGPRGPDNPHPAAASRASGSNCGRRCSRTYTV